MPTHAEYARQLRRAERRDIPYQYPSAYKEARNDLLRIGMDNCVWDRLCPYDLHHSTNNMLTVEQQEARRQPEMPDNPACAALWKPEWQRSEVRFCWIKAAASTDKIFMFCMVRKNADTRLELTERSIINNNASPDVTQYYLVPQSVVKSYKGIYSYTFLWSLYKLLNEKDPSRFPWAAKLSGQLSDFSATRLPNSLSWTALKQHLFLTLSIAPDDAVGRKHVSVGPGIAHTFTGSLVTRHTKEAEHNSGSSPPACMKYQLIYVDNPASKYVKMQRGNIDRLVRFMHDAMVCGTVLSHYTNNPPDRVLSSDDFKGLAALLTVDLEAVRGFIWQLNCALTPEMERMRNGGTIDEARRLFGIPVYSDISYVPASEDAVVTSAFARRFPSSSPIMSLSDVTSQVAPGDSADAYDQDTVAIPMDADAGDDPSELCHVFVNIRSGGGDSDDDAETVEA